MMRYVCVVLFAALLGGTVSGLGLEDRFQINGYSSFEFEKQFGDKGKGDPNGSFDADLFDLVTNFQPINNLRVVADITWEHGAASEDGRGNVAVEYAFPEYTVNRWLKFRAGKMFVPFGIYNEIHTAKPAIVSVKEPLSTNKNDKFGSAVRFYPRWACGAAVLGNMKVRRTYLDYILQVSNGEQEVTNPFEEDDNPEKAVAGRLRVSPVPAFTLGVSGYYDSKTDWASVVDGDGEVELEDNGRLSLWSAGAQLEYELAGAALQAEYVAGAYRTGAHEEISRWALTGMVSYTLFDRYTPYLRYEHLDPDMNVDDDNGKMLVYGINVQVAAPLFLKVENNTIMADDGNARFKGGKNRYNELKVSIAAGF